jgi:predicted RND superfamily exporter protein
MVKNTEIEVDVKKTIKKLLTVTFAVIVFVMVMVLIRSFSSCIRYQVSVETSALTLTGGSDDKKNK